MSISSANRKAGPYSCNGATVAFPFAFKVFTTDDVLVVLTDSLGVESKLSLGTGYTVSINAEQDSNPGGTVTTAATYAAGNKITLSSQVQNLQPVTLTNNGGFYPQVINDALDRLTILIQQVAEQANRAFKVGISSTQTPDELIQQLVQSTADAEASAADALVAAQQAAAAAAAAQASAESIDTSSFAAKTGGNATGTWPISVTGQAGSVANNSVTTAKLARQGSAGQILYSGGAGADPYYGEAPAAGVTSVNGNSGAITAGQIAAAATAGYGYTPASVSHSHSYAPMTAVVAISDYIAEDTNNPRRCVCTRADGSTFTFKIGPVVSSSA